jgi:hypothetical protein
MQERDTRTSEEEGSRLSRRHVSAIGTASLGNSNLDDFGIAAIVGASNERDHLQVFYAAIHHLKPQSRGIQSSVWSARTSSCQR